MTKKKLGKTKQAGTKPVLGVDLFRCFLCQREGQSPPLRRCSQCEIAFYCSKDCQRGHWKTHKAACVAAVAAKAVVETVEVLEEVMVAEVSMEATVDGADEREDLEAVLAVLVALEVVLADLQEEVETAVVI